MTFVTLVEDGFPYFTTICLSAPTSFGHAIAILDALAFLCRCCRLFRIFADYTFIRSLKVKCMSCCCSSISYSISFRLVFKRIICKIFTFILFSTDKDNLNVFFGLRFQRACLCGSPLNYCNRTCNCPNQPIMSSSSSSVINWHARAYIESIRANM